MVETRSYNCPDVEPKKRINQRIGEENKGKTNNPSATAENQTADSSTMARNERQKHPQWQECQLNKLLIQNGFNGTQR